MLESVRRFITRVLGREADEEIYSLTPRGHRVVELINQGMGYSDALAKANQEFGDVKSRKVSAGNQWVAADRSIDPLSPGDKADRMYTGNWLRSIYGAYACTDHVSCGGFVEVNEQEKQIRSGVFVKNS